MMTFILLVVIGAGTQRIDGYPTRESCEVAARAVNDNITRYYYGKSICIEAPLQAAKSEK